MNIVFVTEQQFTGEVPTDFRNLRTEFGWMKMLGAFHLPYSEMLNKETQHKETIEKADLLVFIPSKTHPEFLETILSYKNKNIAIVQEGPNNYWQEWSTKHQLLYLSIIKTTAAIIFCHNEYDKKYFEAITTIPVVVLPTVHEVKKWLGKRVSPENKEESVFIGGNMCRWYNGANSYLVASHPKIKKILFPSMGRKKEDEVVVMSQIDKRVNYLPYLQVSDFLNVLSNFKYAVHLMPEVAAASFSLNCAMLGIPCIGNVFCDTQRKCFPDLSIHINDLALASHLMNKLTTDKDFYDEVVKKATEAVKEFDIDYNREKILKKIKMFIEKEYEVDMNLKKPDGVLLGTPAHNTLESRLTKMRYSFIFNHDKDFFKDKVVLDVGCGWGLGTKLVVENGAKEVCGVDLHPDAINIAKAEYNSSKIRYVCGAFEEQRFPKKAFDVIVAVEFVEHIPPDGFLKFLDVCKDILVDKGYIYITTPSLRGRKEDFPKGSHYTEYTIEELSDILKKHDFKVVWSLGTELTKDTGFALLAQKVI